MLLENGLTSAAKMPNNIASPNDVVKNTPKAVHCERRSSIAGRTGCCSSPSDESSSASVLLDLLSCSVNFGEKETFPPMVSTVFVSGRTGETRRQEGIAEVGLMGCFMEDMVWGDGEGVRVEREEGVQRGQVGSVCVRRIMWGVSGTSV